MENGDQIKAFEKQLESSFDFKFDQLRELDEKKSQALLSLQNSILAQIKQERKDSPSTPEKEEKYSADLKLTEQELESVFDAVKKTYAQLFSENSIETFMDFKIFIGFEGDSDIILAKPLQEITLFGQSIDLTLPPGTNENTIKNYKQIFHQIEQREDLKPFISSATKFTPNGSARIEFKIQKDGKEIKYSANPDGVLRVDSEPNNDDKKELIRITLARKRLEKKLSSALRQDKTYNENVFGGDGSMEAINIEEMIYSAERGEDVPLLNFNNGSIPKKYEALVTQIMQLVYQERALKQNCAKRTLHDEQHSTTVIEDTDPFYTMNSVYEYLDTNGDISKRIIYNSYSKYDVSEYFPGGHKFQKTTNFHPNGNIREVSEYSQDGEIVSTMRYRENGTLEVKKIGRNYDMYDESGKSIMYRKISPEKTGDRTQLFRVGPNGENFGDFEYEKGLNPNLTEDEYIKRFKDAIKTKDQFFASEEMFQDQGSKLSPELAQAIRQYGIELSGLKEKEKQFESKYGIEIETEKWSITHITNSRLPIKTLDSTIIALHKRIDRYPLTFIQNSGLKKLYIFGDWTDNSQKNSPTSTGGFSLGNGEIGINSEYGFDHELLHCIDTKYGGLDDDNAGWGKRAHGKNYKSLYGKNGQEAIRSGRAYEKRPKGYANAYGKYGGIDEDQATMAEAIMGMGDDVHNTLSDNMLVGYNTVLRYMANEPELVEKMKMIKELYYALSDGKMDSKFWEDLSKNKKIDFEYWEKRESAQDFVLDPKFEGARKNLKLSKQFNERIKTGMTPEEIISIYEEMIENGTNDPKVYAYLGVFYEHKDPAKAWLNLNLAIEKGSSDISVYIKVADHYKEKGQIKEQIKTLDLAMEVVSLSILHNYICLNLAEAYLKIGNKDKAIQAYELTLGKDFRVIAPLTYLYYSYKHDIEKAKIVYFTDEPQKTSDNHSSYEYQNKLANFYTFLLDTTLEENYSKFDKKYQIKNTKSVMINPEFLKRYPDIASLHSKKTEALIKACTSEEASAYNFKDLADSCYQQGKPDLAIKTLKEAMVRFADKEYSLKDLRVNMAGMFLAQGNIDEAAKACLESKDAYIAHDVVDASSDLVRIPIENVIKFYDSLLATVGDFNIYSDYAHYLRKNNQPEKLKAVVDDAIKKLPEDKDYFEDLLKNK